MNQPIPAPRTMSDAKCFRTAKRDAQVAKAEIERLSAETAKLNAALERLETDKNAVEGRARTMEFVVYGAIIILISLMKPSPSGFIAAPAAG